MDGLIEMMRNTRGTVVEDKSQADALAWAALEPKGRLFEIGIKHPPLPDNGVKIKITYTGVCQSDVSILHKKYGDMLPSIFPCVCGHEIVGRVLAFGKNVTNFKEGEMVGVGPVRDCCLNCTYCKSGLGNLCNGPVYKFTAGSYFGGFATEIQLPCNFVFKIPDGVDEKQCPSLFCAGGTVFAPLRKYGREGAKCAIIGIGGLGHLGLMFANKMGMKVYAISTSDSKKQMALEFGAHEFVNSRDENSMKNFMNEEIDLIINTAGISDVMPYIRGLRKGTGVFVQAAGPEKGLDISYPELILGQYTIAGTAAFSHEDAQAMLDLVVKHQIYPKCEYFTWDNFNDAVDKCANNKVEFRSVVDVGTAKK